MEAVVGGSEDGLVDSVVDDRLVDGVDKRLVDGMVDNWCRLWHWDDTAAHLARKLHRDLPGGESFDMMWKNLLIIYPES